MGLVDVERALARLYTDAALRERFAANPAQAAAELALSPEDSAYLAETPASDIEGFARSLVAKRWGEVRKLLPLSCRALGEQGLRPTFEAYARTHVLSGTHKHLEDALAFANHHLATLQKTEAPSWRRDVLRYEALRLRLLSCRWGARLARFACDVRAYAADGSLAEPPHRARLIAWFRTPNRLREWQW